jgi:hypothetical protein
MVNACIVVTPLFQMTFQFPKPFFCGLFVGADAFDSESLAVRNTFGAMFRMTTLWGPFVSTYHPALSNLSNIVREHWTTIQKHPELCKIFKEPPVLAFRKLPKESWWPVDLRCLLSGRSGL